MRSHEVMRQGEIFSWLRKFQGRQDQEFWSERIESMDEALLCLEQPDLLRSRSFSTFFARSRSSLFPHAKEKERCHHRQAASGQADYSPERLTKDTKFAATDHRSYNRDGQQFNVGETFAACPSRRVSSWQKI